MQEKGEEDDFLRALCMKLSDEQAEEDSAEPVAKMPKLEGRVEDVVDGDDEEREQGDTEKVKLETPMLQVEPPKRELPPPMDDEQMESGSAHSFNENGDPQENGEPSQIMDFEASTTSSIQDQLNDISRQCTFLSHQMSVILNTMNVRPCLCPPCETHIKGMKHDKWAARAQQILQHQHQQQSQHGSMPPRISMRPPNLPYGMPNLTPNTSHHPQTPNTPRTPNEDKNSLPESEVQFIQQLMAQDTQSSQPGRRSKYCTSEEKKQVAAYAQMHGAAAAARHFNIPAPVAAYYQRKHSQRAQQGVSSLFAQQQAIMAAAAAGLPGMFLGGPPMLTPTTPTGRDDPATPTHTPSTPSTPQPNGEMAFKMNGMPGMQSGLSTPGGNQMFVRGRGRGRPKLIGDELDMHLVEYMVQYKKADVGQHLTASRALDIARDYIVAKAPGLLEEHGGQIKLKITWAMKLVQRVAEREREIELGLPPGTLQNLGRMVQHLPQNGQNGQPSQPGSQPSTPQTASSQAPVDFEALFQAFAQSAAQQNNMPTNENAVTPEIIKGQEIDLVALLGLCQEAGATEGQCEGEEEDGDNDEKEVESAPSISPQSAEEPLENGEQQPPPSQSNSHQNFIYAS